MEAARKESSVGFEPYAATSFIHRYVAAISVSHLQHLGLFKRMTFDVS